MMDLTEARMVEPMEENGSGGRSIMWMMLSGLGIVMTAGAIAGYLAEHQSQGGGPLDTMGIIVLAVFLAIIAGLSYAIWRNGSKIKDRHGRLPRREKLNQRIMVFSALLGGGIALALMASSTAEYGDPTVFAEAPIKPWVAIIVALIIGVGMPILSVYWHYRVIDEQEADAYRSGALIAIYTFWIGAPVWWLLWRGGLVPAPDGVIIYMATTIIALIIWFWKKYR
jgi:hypothetical protein